MFIWFFFFFQAEDGIRDRDVTGVQTCALPISHRGLRQGASGHARDPGPLHGDRAGHGHVQGPRSANHLTRAGGATAASVWPLALSALATKPEAFISSMNSRR